MPLTSRQAGITPGAHPITQVQPYQVGIGDLDADGLPDLTSPLGDSLLVHLGRAGGTLAPPRGTFAPGGADYSSVTDFDRDGHADIAWAGRSSSGVLFGDGSGASWFSHALSTRDALGLATGDFDGDGSPDVAILSGTGTPHLRTFLSRPGRSFEAVDQPLDSLGAARAVRVADIDGDGRTDIVVANRVFGCTNVLVSRGDGGFVHRRLLLSGRLDVGDLDGDGWVDVVAAEGFFARWVRGLGDGTFGAPVALSASSRPQEDVAVGDLDGDGKLDVVSTTDIGQVLTRRGLGGGAFEAPRTQLVGRRLVPSSLVDLNRDERLDLVAMSPTAHGMFVALGDGAGGFLGRTAAVPVPSLVHAASGDFDEDGAADVVVVCSSPARVGVLLARPGRSFEARPYRAVDAIQVGCVTDANLDGHVDLILLLTGSRIGTLLGNGDGTFGEPVVTVHAGSAMAFGDLTADGRVDLVTASADTVRVLPGRGDGTFGPALASRASATVRLVRVGDLNGDGIGDLGLMLSAGPPWAPTDHAVQRLVSAGPGSWTPQPFQWLGASGLAPWIAIGDMDGSGADDLVLRRNGRLSAMAQGPQGETLLGPTIPWTTHETVIELHDVDADGDLDACAPGSYGWLIAPGDGTGFSAALGLHGASASFGLVDLDRDGRLDLFGRHRSDVELQTTSDSLVVHFGRDDAAPAVRLVGPVPGTALPIGATTRVAWELEEAADLQSVEVYLSRRGPAGPFQKLAVQQPGAVGFDWTVSGTPGDSVRFKLVARDSAENSASCVSGSFLLVERLAMQPPHLAAGGGLAIAGIRPHPAPMRFLVAFDLPRAGPAALTLHDLQGRRLATLADGSWPAGRSLVPVEVPDGLRAPGPGLHFLRLSTPAGSDAARLVLLR